MVVDVVEKEYLAYLFINNRNSKLHRQLKKNIANNYSKGNTDAYPSDIHKALTLTTEYQPLKLDAPVITSQGTAFVTSGRGRNGKVAKKYIPKDKWNALSAEAKAKLIEACKKGGLEKSDKDDKSVLSSKLVKTTKSLSKAIKARNKENEKLKKLVALQQ